MVSNQSSSLIPLNSILKRASTLGFVFSFIVLNFFVFITSYFDSVSESYYDAGTIARIISVAFESTESKSGIERLMTSYGSNRKISQILLLDLKRKSIIVSSRPFVGEFPFTELETYQYNGRSFVRESKASIELLKTGKLRIAESIRIEKFSSSDIPPGEYSIVVEYYVNPFRETFLVNLMTAILVLMISISSLLLIQKRIVENRFLAPFRTLIAAIGYWNNETKKLIIKLDGRGEIIALRDQFMNLVTSLEESRRNEIQKSKLLSEIMEAINKSAIVSFTDKNGKIEDVNDNFVQVSGYSKDELIGSDHRVVNSGFHSKLFFKKMWTSISSGHAWTGDIQNRKKSGESYYVRSIIAPIRSVDGEIEKYMAIRFDVTEEKQNENLLKEAQEIAKIGSWVFNLETNSLRWTTELFRIFEIDESCDPKKLFEVYRSKVHPEDLPELDRAVQNSLENGQSYVIHHRIQVSNSQIKHVRGMGKVVKNQSGNPIILSGTCQDVTEQVQLEVALQHEKAKAAHSAKLASLGEMSAGIAHEINNPLAIISGSLSLLHKFKDDEAKFNSKVEIIRKATSRIEKIVKGLKKFSRAANEYIRNAEDLAVILQDAITIVETKSKRHDVPIHSSISQNLILSCDQVEIEQVVVNLLNNSIDAVKSRHLRWVRVEAFQEEENIVLRVIDSGSGISSEIESKLFQPFFTTKPVGEGTGLGLSIAKGIIEDHKGTLALNRNYETTCFEIKFPILKDTSQEVKNAS